jgi:hypothetical protein
MVDQQNGDVVESAPRGSSTHDELGLNGRQCFSSDACECLGRAVEKYHRMPGAFDDVETATYTLCQEAKASGLGVNQALAKIRWELDRAFAGRQLTSSDRAAVIALAVDQCVRAYYAGKGAPDDSAKEAGGSGSSGK